jgi:hypothetical protein
MYNKQKLCFCYKQHSIATDMRNIQLKNYFYILIIAVVVFCNYLIINNFNQIDNKRLEFSKVNYSNSYNKLYIDLINEHRLNSLFRILYQKELDFRFKNFLKRLGILSFESIAKDSLIKPEYQKEIETYLSINKENNEIQIKQQFLNDLFDTFHFYSYNQWDNSHTKVTNPNYLTTKKLFY